MAETPGQTPPPPLPVVERGPYTCCMPWLAGRLADGVYVLETDEYQILLDGPGLRAWAQRIVDQIDADAAREVRR